MGSCTGGSTSSQIASARGRLPRRSELVTLRRHSCRHARIGQTSWSRCPATGNTVRRGLHLNSDLRSPALPGILASPSVALLTMYIPRARADEFRTYVHFPGFQCTSRPATRHQSPPLWVGLVLSAFGTSILDSAPDGIGDRGVRDRSAQPGLAQRVAAGDEPGRRGHREGVVQLRAGPGTRLGVSRRRSASRQR